MKFSTMERIQIDISVSETRKKMGVVMPELVHKDKILHAETGKEDLTGYDAVITSNRTLQVGIATADCAPVCFGDGAQIAIAHVGWPGLCLKLHTKVLSLFEWDTVEIFVAPFMHVFELQRDFCYDALKEKYGEAFFYEEENKLYFRFKDALASGLPPQTVFDPRSTFSDPLLPSYRRDKTSQRLITVVQFS